MPQLNYMASKMKAFGIMGPEDLVQSAVAGLMRARETFDPARGVKWATYALHRARGAMLDALRDIDWVPRIERRRLKAEGLDAKAILSIDYQAEKVGEQGGLPRLRDQTAEGVDFWRSVRRRLGARLGEVVERYFREDRTLKQIGQLMGMSESRACQLLANGLKSLRKIWGREPLLEVAR